MKSLFIVLVMCVISVCALGQASNMISISALRQESDVASAYSHADMKRLMRTARTREEFDQIALYFDWQAQMYAAKSHSEENELYRLLALPFHARSYPAQVESTRNQIAHFKALSHKCSEEADLYRARANADGTKGAAAALPPNSSQ
jgi:hypothetical protein